MPLKETLRLIGAIALACGTAHAANLADPAVLIPPARLSIGASYDLGGNSITNGTVPSIMNRVQARLSYSPFSFLNFGIDGGTTQMDVAGDTTATDTFGVFHGGYGLSGEFDHLLVFAPGLPVLEVRPAGARRWRYVSSSRLGWRIAKKTLKKFLKYLCHQM